MIKNKPDFKLINVTLIAVICFLVYKSNGLWLGILGKVGSIILPLLAGFAIAYALYPILETLIKHKIPKSLATTIIWIVIFAIVITVVILMIPMLSTQIVSLIDSLVVFIRDISTNFNIDFGSIEDTLMNAFNQIITNVGKYVSDGAVKTINTSINVITNIVIALASGVYFLLDMDKIRKEFKQFLIEKSNKMYLYVSMVDKEMKKYIKGFLQIVCISFFEYTIFFYIIGHPSALILGFLSAFGNFIPYFGGIIVQIIAIATSFVISPALCLRVIILSMILGAFDGYFLNPFIYGKSNQVHPIIVIAAVFAGGILFGFLGIMIALPLSIIIITTVKFYRENYVGKEIKKSMNTKK